MNKRTEIATRQEALPGIEPPPDVGAGRLLDQFTVWDETGAVYASRLPTADERDRLTRRHAALDRNLRPLSADARDQDAVKKALAAFFLGYPSLNNADAPGMIAAYITDLRTMPAWAAIKALEKIKRGEVEDVDRRSGRAVPLDPDWPPSSARVYQVAQRIASKPIEEHSKIGRLLGARSAVPEMADEERAAAGARVRAMADEIRGLIARPDASQRAALDEREQRRRHREAAMRAEFEERCREEYADLGLEPRKIGGLMVSPELAAKMDAVVATAMDERHRQLE